MSTSSDSFDFCLLCYKPTGSTSLINTNLEISYNFVKVVSRFSGRLDIQNIFTDLVNNKQLTQCCNSCKQIMKSFCESYHQLKILELKLESTLDKLVEKVNYANKVPARWIHVNRVLEESFPNNLVKKVENQTRIRKFRQNLIEAGRQRKLLSQPRVLLKKTESVIQEVQRSSPTIDYSNIDLSNSQTTNVTEKTKRFYRKGLSKTCPKCGKMLRSPRGLEIHLEHHKGPNEWKWRCHLCSRKFTTEDNLNAHLRSHTGEKPYKCRFCGQKFGYRSNFTRHLKVVHKGEKGANEEIKRKWFIKPTQRSKLLKEKSTLCNEDDSMEFGPFHDPGDKTEYDDDITTRNVNYNFDMNSFIEDVDPIHDDEYIDTNYTDQMAPNPVDPLIQVKVEHRLDLHVIRCSESSNIN